KSREITIVSIERKVEAKLPTLQQRKHIVPKAATTFQAGDIALVLGEEAAVKSWIKEFTLEEIRLPLQMNKRRHLLSRQFGIVEMIIPAHSTFENKTIRE